MYKKIVSVFLTIVLLFSWTTIVFASDPTGTPEPQTQIEVLTAILLPSDGGEKKYVQIFYTNELDSDYIFSNFPVSIQTEDGIVRSELVKYSNGCEYFTLIYKHSDPDGALAMDAEGSDEVVGFFPQFLHLEFIPSPDFSNNKGAKPEEILSGLVKFEEPPFELEYEEPKSII
jgi:hypothetical protein